MHRSLIDALHVYAIVRRAKGPFLETFIEELFEITYYHSLDCFLQSNNMSGYIRYLATKKQDLALVGISHQQASYAVIRLWEFEGLFRLLMEEVFNNSQVLRTLITYDTMINIMMLAADKYESAKIRYLSDIHFNNIVFLAENK